MSKKSSSEGGVFENASGLEDTMLEDGDVTYHSENSSTSSGKENVSYLNSILSNECSISAVSGTFPDNLQQKSSVQDTTTPTCATKIENQKSGGITHGTEKTERLNIKFLDEKDLDWADPNLLERVPVNCLIDALKKEGFDVFITLLKKSASTSKKVTVAPLLQIVKEIPIKIPELVTLTTDSMRSLRYLSTLLCYELLKTKIRDRDNFEHIFEEVLMKRYKDVDPNIRSLSIGFFADMVLMLPEYFGSAHFEIFAKSMVDKSEIVRRKSIKALKKLLALKDTKNLGAFYQKNLKVVSELSAFDRCESVRNDCASLMFLLYEGRIVRKEACLKVLHLASNKVFNKILREIRSEVGGSAAKRGRGGVKSVLFPVSVLHELLDINEKSLSLLKFTQAELNEYIESVMEDLTCDRCCKRNFSCKLKILSIINLPTTPQSYFIRLLEMIKDNPHNIRLVMDALMTMDFGIASAETDEIVKILFELNKNFRNQFLDPFLKLVKKIGVSISSYYTDLILSEETCVTVAKYFDVSYYESGNVLFQCYCFLWRTINKDFRDVQLEGNFDEDIISLFNFLVFFKGKLNLPGNVKNPIQVFYNRLEEYVGEYIGAKKLTTAELDELSKLVKRGILADAKYLFKKDLVKERKLEEFFGGLLGTRRLDKNLAKKISRETRGVSVFEHLKNCAGNDLEEVCGYFVSGLSSSEAIYLENRCKLKKVKSLLLKKINAVNKSDFPSSPIRGNEDVVSL